MAIASVAHLEDYLFQTIAITCFGDGSVMVGAIYAACVYIYALARARSNDVSF